MRLRSRLFQYFPAAMIAALICCPGWAQTGAPSKFAVLTGQTANSVTGEPVPLAHVLLQGANPQNIKAAISDSGGHFTFRDIQPGAYALSGERTEYMRGEYSAAVSGQRGKGITFQAGQVVDNLKLVLIPQGVITGTIVGDDGDPLPGIQVNAFHCESGSPARASRAFSDDLGQFRLHGLPPGRYCVGVSNRVRGRGMGAGDAGDGSGTTFYPHALSASDATVLDVTPGNVVKGINFGISVGTTVTPRTQAGSSAGTGSLQGRVVNTATGEGIRNAEVDLSSENEASESSIGTVADGSGNFSLSGIRPGEYRISAAHAGFLFGEYGSGGASGLGKKVTITADQTLDGVDLGLVPQGVIAGKVLEGDVPLPNAIVIAVHGAYINGRHRYVLATRAYTDDLGNYRLSGLAPGHYYLSTTYRNGLTPGYVPQDAPSSEAAVAWDQAYVTTYYPQALSLHDAVPVQVMPGSVQTAIDLPIFRIQKARITGKVVLPAARGFGGNLSVALVPRDPGFVAKFSQMDATVDEGTGRFELNGVPPGAYVVAADWTNGSTTYSARQPVDVGKGNIDGLTVSLALNLNFQGRVVKAQPGALDFSSLQVSLQSVEDAPMGSNGSGPVGSNGAFVIENLRPGRYIASISGLNGDYYVKSISVGGQDFTQSELELVRSSAAISLVISATAGKITGTVVNDQQQPVAGATVAIVPEVRLRAHSDLYKSTTTDSGGNFDLEGITPGDYKIFAWEDIAPNSYQDPDVISLFEGQGQPVSVGESSSQKVQVNVISSGNVIR